MRILLFGHCSGLAGAERSVLELVRQLRNRYGVDCAVVLPEEGPLIGRLEGLAVSVHVVPYGWWCRWETSSPHENLNTVRRFCREEGKAFDPDLVLTISFAAPWGAVAASLLGKPHLWYVHETGRNFDFTLGFDEVISVIDESSNAILAVSEASRAAFERKCADRVSIAYVDIPRPALADSESGPLPRRLFGRVPEVRLLVPSTLTPHKGQADAIEGLVELRERGIDARLQLAGSGSDAFLEQLRHLAEEQGVGAQVDFLGFRDDVPALMTEADIVLVCSRDTALDRVLIEAMQLRRPLVAARSGGAIEASGEGARALLYEPGNPHSLAEAVEKIIDHPREAVRRRERAAAYAETHFTPDRFSGVVHREATRIARQPNPTSPEWGKHLAETLESARRASEE